MTPNRAAIRLATGVAVLLWAVPIFAQDLQGFQPVAPAEISPYGTGPQPHEGYFFSIDQLYWSISAPAKTLIGAPGERRVAERVFPIQRSGNNNDLGTYALVEERDFFSAEDTTRLESKFVGGERIELGHVEDGRGWMLSAFKLRDQNQGFDLGVTDVNFNDPFSIQSHDLVSGVDIAHPYLFGQIGLADIVTGHTGTDNTDVVINNAALQANLPVTFSSLQVRLHQAQMWNVELSYLRRLRPFHYGGNLEWFLGARYIELDDEFDVLGIGGVLDVSQWTSTAQNHIVGPQLGGRYFKQFARLIVSTEGRFLAGFNRQNFRLAGFLGSSLANASDPGNLALDGQSKPVGWAGSEFSGSANLNDFSGVAELRTELKYVLTRNVDIRVGWTGIWLGHIGRATDAIAYQVPKMEIDTSHHRQDVFVYGINVGVDINR